MRNRYLPLICGGALLLGLLACDSDSTTKAGDTTVAVADGGDTGPGAVALGAPCSIEGEKKCSEEAKVYECRLGGGVGFSWRPVPNDPDGQTCSCSDVGGELSVSCGIPGFVGLDRTGRARKAPTLRALRRAAHVLAGA